MVWMTRIGIKKIQNALVELISLSTPRSRLCLWAIATIAIFILPYRFFENISLWQRLGWDTAPSIGLTRAYWLLIHGDIIAAWHRNRYIYAVVAVGAVILTIDVYKIIKNMQIGNANNSHLR